MSTPRFNRGGTQTARSVALLVVGSLLALLALLGLAAGIALARAFLKEPIAPAQLAGMALIFGGVAALAGL